MRSQVLRRSVVQYFERHYRDLVLHVFWDAQPVQCPQRIGDAIESGG